MPSVPIRTQGSRGILFKNWTVFNLTRCLQNSALMMQDTEKTRNNTLKRLKAVSLTRLEIVQYIHFFRCFSVDIVIFFVFEFYSFEDFSQQILIYMNKCIFISLHFFLNWPIDQFFEILQKLKGMREGRLFQRVSSQRFCIQYVVVFLTQMNVSIRHTYSSCWQLRFGLWTLRERKNAQFSLSFSHL